MWRFGRNQQGAVAIEFALLSPLYFAVLFALLETGLLMTKITVLDGAVAQASRLVYTGQAPTKEDLEAEICAKTVMLQDCANNINVEILQLSELDETALGGIECKDSSNASFSPTTNYHESAGGEIILIRVCVTTTLITPGLGMGFALGGGDNRTQITSSLAFMNEPFT